MSLVRRARQLGLRIEIVELGTWGGVHAEYDAHGRVIRVHAGRMRELHGGQRRRFFVRAIAHELYHHLEAIGAIERLRTYAQREAAADDFARAAAA